VVDPGKFLEFVDQVYLDSIGTGPFGDPIIHPKQWATGLANTRILNLLVIPHFGRGKEVKECVKQLMEILHGGFLWLEDLFSLDVELIAIIIGPPFMGKHLAQYLDDKKKEKALAEEMKKTYNTERGSCWIIMKIISETLMRMDTKLIACKMLRKFRKEEVPVRDVIAVAQ
jgi:hypothetical protein